MMADRLLDLLLPPQCLACGALVAGHGGLCAGCWGGMDFIATPCCARCGDPFERGDGDLHCADCLRAPPAFDRARAVFRYDDHGRGLVLSFKHADRPGLARFFAPWMARAAADLLRDADLLVPVPLHRWRLLHRRYNQAALLAVALSRHAGIPCRPDLLQRVRRTAPQGDLGRDDRRRNVKGAFRLGRRDERLDGRRVLLIDDVLTTGATIGECARLLRQAGAVVVDVVTLARVVVT